MPARSWLAEAKSLHDLGDHFYLPKAGTEWDDTRAERAEDKWLERLRRPFPQSVANPEFFGSRMHDSGVIGIERRKGVLRVRLDSIAASDFARILEDALDGPPAEGPWPVDLLLHDPTYVRAARADLRGGLRFDDLLREQGVQSGRNMPRMSFLYDWFHEQNGRLQWIAQLWPHREHRASRSEDLYLMVDCAQATADDRCPEAFGRAYGPQGRKLYEEARANAFVPDEPFNLWNEAGLARSLPTRLAAHGLTRGDFSPA